MFTIWRADRVVETMARNRILCWLAFVSISPVVVTRGIAEEEHNVGSHRLWADDAGA